MQARLLLSAGLSVGFALAAPSPRSAVHLAASSPASAQDLDAATAPLVGALALLGWAVLAWLLATACLLLAGRLPGAAGRFGRLLATAVAPAVVRRTLAVALGLSLAAGTPAAWAAPGADPLDWPVSAPAAATVTAPSAQPVAPASSDPVVALTAGPRVPAAIPPAIPPATASSYVVQPGDSLWSIAADQLPDGASAARIASAWPSWWSANRDRLGADPDLIHPGTRLTPPSTVKE